VVEKDSVAGRDDGALYLPGQIGVLVDALVEVPHERLWHAHALELVPDRRPTRLDLFSAVLAGATDLHVDGHATGLAGSPGRDGVRTG